MKIKALVLLLPILIVFPISAMAQKKVQSQAQAPLIPMKDFFRNRWKSFWASTSVAESRKRVTEDQVF